MLCRREECRRSCDCRDVKGTVDQVDDAGLRISKMCFAGEKNADGADLDSC